LIICAVEEKKNTIKDLPFYKRISEEDVVIGVFGDEKGGSIGVTTLIRALCEMGPADNNKQYFAVERIGPTTEHPQAVLFKNPDDPNLPKIWLVDCANYQNFADLEEYSKIIYMTSKKNEIPTISSMERLAYLRKFWREKIMLVHSWSDEIPQYDQRDEKRWREKYGERITGFSFNDVYFTSAVNFDADSQKDVQCNLELNRLREYLNNFNGDRNRFGDGPAMAFVRRNKKKLALGATIATTLVPTVYEAYENLKK